MELSALTGQSSDASRVQMQASRRQQGFSSMLTGSSRQAEARGLTQKQQIERASEQLVSSALIKPLFKQMRESPFKVERFHGGQGEQAFMQQLHTVLADRITNSANFNVADAIYQKMTRSVTGPTRGETPGGVDTHG